MQYFRRRRKCRANGNMSRRGQHGSSNLLFLSRRGGGLDLLATLAFLFSTVPLLVQSGKPKVMADSEIALHPHVPWDNAETSRFWCPVVGWIVQSSLIQFSPIQFSPTRSRVPFRKSAWIGFTMRCGELRCGVVNGSSNESCNAHGAK